MRLKDKVVFITGAGQGIGRTAALLFAEEGAQIVVNDIDKQKAADTANLISENGGEALPVVADISQEVEVQRLISEGITHFGRIDVLYNNAGIFVDSDGSLPDLNIWEQVLTVNLTGTYLCCKYAIPELMKAGGGSIINIGSFVALRGITFPQDAYAVSKAGIFTLTRSLAVIYGQHNIRVNCIAPGPIETRMTLPKQPHLDRIPLRRHGQPEEVARTALFLASDEASLITGVILPVDGGLSAISIHPKDSDTYPLT